MDPILTEELMIKYNSLSEEQRQVISPSIFVKKHESILKDPAKAAFILKLSSHGVGETFQRLLALMSKELGSLIILDTTDDMITIKIKDEVLHSSHRGPNRIDDTASILNFYYENREALIDKYYINSVFDTILGEQSGHTII